MKESVRFAEYLRRIQPFWREYQAALDRLKVQPNPWDGMRYDHELYRKFRNQCALVVRTMSEKRELVRRQKDR